MPRGRMPVAEVPVNTLRNRHKSSLQLQVLLSTRWIDNDYRSSVPGTKPISLHGARRRPDWNPTNNLSTGGERAACDSRSGANATKYI